MTTQLAPATRVTGQPRGGLRHVPTLAAGTDLLVVTLSVMVAILGRHFLEFPNPFPDKQTSDALSIVGPVLLVGWVVAILFLGGYRRDVFGAGLEEYKRVINASLVTAALASTVCYLARFPLSRGFFILSFALGIPLLVLGRLLLRRSLHRARRRGLLQARVVIAGAEGHVDEIASVLNRETWLGYRVVGAMTTLPNDRTETHSGIPVLGRVDALASTAVDAGADVVFLVGGAFESSSQMRRLAWDLEGEDIQVVIAPSVTDVSSERIRLRPVGGMPLIHLEKPRSEAAVRRAKRTFDVVGSALLLLAFSPLFALAAWKVKRFDGGPVFFRQPRVGRDNEVFHVWKFRTMVTNAEELLEDLKRQKAESGEDEDVLFKMEDDPRVTAPGRWLRRFSIDELPQLLNVVTGDMSLVGPRPPLAHEVAQYSDDMTRRLRVRPGMTGLWQVSGRSDLSWSEAIRLDLYYVDNWSMLQDLTILGRTLGAVLSSRGAY